MAGTRITYRLPVSKLVVTGRQERSHVVDWGQGAIHAVAVRDVEVEVTAVAGTARADRRAVTLSPRTSKDADYTLELYPDGRVKAFTAAQTERIGDIVGAVAKVGGLVGGIAATLLVPAPLGPAAGVALGALSRRLLAAPADGEEAPVDEATGAARALFRGWEASFPNHAQRARDLYATITDIDAIMREKATTIAESIGVATPERGSGDGSGPEEASKAKAAAGSGLADQWKAAGEVRDALAEELAALEEGVRAWASALDVDAGDAEFVIDLDDLPLAEDGDALPARWEPTAAQLAQPWASELGILVVRRDHGGVGGVSDNDAAHENDVRVRMPRPVTFGVYIAPASGAGAEAGEGSWRLWRTLAAGVVDASSPVTALPLGIEGLGDSAIGVALTEAGLPTTISYGKHSAGKSAADAAEGAVTKAGEGLGAAVGLLEQARKAQVAGDELRAAGAERRIADLERAKKLVAAESAYASEVVARRYADAAAHVAQRQELLRMLRDIGGGENEKADAAAG